MLQRTEFCDLLHLVLNSGVQPAATFVSYIKLHKYLDITRTIYFYFTCVVSERAHHDGCGPLSENVRHPCYYALKNVRSYFSLSCLNYTSSTVPLENLTVARLVKFPTFYGMRKLILCSRESARCHCPKPHTPSPHSHTLVIGTTTTTTTTNNNNNNNLFFHLRLSFPNCFFRSSFPTKMSVNYHAFYMPDRPYSSSSDTIRCTLYFVLYDYFLVVKGPAAHATDTLQP
jgi:hypothetical protein